MCIVAQQTLSAYDMRLICSQLSHLFFYNATSIFVVLDGKPLILNLTVDVSLRKRKTPSQPRE